MRSDKYLVYLNNLVCARLTLRDLIDFRRSATPKPRIWSARLSTGAFGLPGCRAGNRGPLEANEVILGVGEQGLARLIGLRFIPCSVCKPEDTESFWSDFIRRKVSFSHGSQCRAKFSDKTVLPYDARRVRYEEIIPLLGAWPSRVYVPGGLKAAAVDRFNEKIYSIGHPEFPDVGWYDPDSPGHFRTY